MRRFIIAFAIIAGTAAIAPASEVNPQKLRVIIETDAGGDPDDEQSLVRFLLYANEWDIEGVICTRPMTKRDENKNPADTGLAIVRRHLAAYEAVYPKLKQHGAFPTPDDLHAKAVAGYDNTDDGVRLIIAAVDRDDPRPIWFSNWGTNDGTTSSLKRALDRVRTERGQEGYANFKNKLRLCSDDMFGDHTTRLEPHWKLWVYTKFPNMDGGRWYHRFGPLTAKAGGFDLARDVLTGHGPLGELYPTNTHLVQKEGDTPEFLYLIPNGLNEPEQPTWGSWAGRFGKQPESGDRPYYWPNVRDTIDGKAHRDNTLLRWVVHLQNDFRARMDWCVKDFDDANHPPQPKLEGRLRRTVKSGDQIGFDATGSTDPDKDALRYEWLYYPEPGTYSGDRIEIQSPAAGKAFFRAPDVASPQTIHVILMVTDAGEPPLTRYVRTITTVEPSAK